MTIHVTQKDIDEGTPCSPRYCPIALALDKIKIFKYADAPQICTDYIRFDVIRGLDSYTLRIPLPTEAMEWSLNYDFYYNQAKPFTFNLSAECFML